MSGNGLSARTDQMILEYQESPSACAVHAWDARFKLLLLVGVVALNIGVAELWLSTLLFVVGVALILWSRVPLRLFAIFFLAPVWATLVVFAGYSIGFGTTPVAQFGPVTIYEEGISAGAAAAARVATDMSWMALVFLTTSMNRLLAALRALRMPEVLVDSIAMAFRYAFLLFDQFYRMLAAVRARGGLKNYRSRLDSIARILAQILLRAYDRAAAIHSAMLARGALAAALPGGAMSGPDAAVAAGRLSNARPLSTEEQYAMDILAPVPFDRAVPILAADALTFSYAQGGRPEISQLNLSVAAGEVLVLCGPNGCGKSTLLKLLAGILRASEGEIRLLGRPLDRQLRNEVFRSVGLLFQDPDDQIFCTHVREDVAYGPTNMGLDAGLIDELVTHAMALTEVAHLAERPTHRLSYGEMKRVALAGLLAMRPPLLLLDEPSAYLDPAAAQQLVAIIRKLHAEHGYSFVVVTHDMDLAATLATRVVVMLEGHILADGSPREILTDQALLRQARLEAPMLTRLFGHLDQAQLGGAPIPVTLEDAERLLDSWRTRDAGA